MSIDETPSFKNLNDQMRGLDLILRANRVLRRIGLGSRQIASLEQQVNEIRMQMRDLADYPERFNRHFSKKGWLAHGRLDFTVMKRAVDECDASGLDAGSAVLLEYFGPESLRQRLFFLNGVEELRVRRRLIDLAFEDYQAGRHHAVVPVLLMLIDGAVNDTVGKGFHSEALDLQVWDSITTADGAINDIKSIFQQGRRKTRTDTILLPYRNGILHGMDLGYDNEIVSAKCWCFLFVVADWIADKKSEDQRRAKFLEDTRIPSLRGLAQQMAENQRMKEATESWSARDITADHLDGLNQGQPPERGTPEEIALQFLALWTARNYGGMARLSWEAAKSKSGKHVGEIRATLGGVEVRSYQLDDINDEAAAISQIRVTVKEMSSNSHCYMFRMIYESDTGGVLGAIVKCCGRGKNQAATSSRASKLRLVSSAVAGAAPTRTPSLNVMPASTAATNWGALTLRQRDSAAWMSLKAMARPALREPAPRVRLVRALTVPKPDSMGLVVRR